MRFESRETFLDAIQAHGLKSDLDWYDESPPDPGVIAFPIPSEHSRILWFARQLLAAAAPRRDLFVMPTLWSVWQSSENWHLYNLFRKACGDNRSLKDAPCHCFSADEHDLALDFIYLFLLFSWDFFIFSFHDNDLLFLSHDEFAIYHSPNRVEHISAIVETLEPVTDDQEANRKLQS
jgi:hypothetical protein